MRKPLTTGERVAVYYAGSGRIAGTIKAVISDSILEVVFPNQYIIHDVHPKQCRRLIKKPKRACGPEFAGSWERAENADPKSIVFVLSKESLLRLPIIIQKEMILQQVLPKKAKP